MRTHVSFHHPAKFVPLSDEEGILSASGVDWFVELLERIPGLQIDRDLCQEDWGVVVFVERHGAKFWIGVGGFFNEDQNWLAHLHHGSFAWLQRFRKSGRDALQQLTTDFHNVLMADPLASNICWYESGETLRADPTSFEQFGRSPGVFRQGRQTLIASARRMSAVDFPQPRSHDKLSQRTHLFAISPSVSPTMELSPTLSRYGDQSPQQLRDTFRRDGFVVLPGFLRPEEVDLLLANIDRYIAEVAPTASAADVNFEDKSRPETLKQLHKLHRYDPFFDKVYNEGPFKRLAADLLGEEVVGNNCQFFSKAPGASLPTPPHQDGYYWRITPCEGLTMWLALDHVDQENGCVSYVKGSHLRGLREHASSGVLGFSQQMTDFGRPEDLENEVAMPARPGDLLVHHALTIHRADGNRSTDRKRRSMGFIYYAASAREDTAANEAYQQKLREELAAAGKI